MPRKDLACRHRLVFLAAALLAELVPCSRPRAQVPDPAPWVGRWVAERADGSVVLWVELRVESGGLEGGVMAQDERAGLIPAQVSLDGDRLTLSLAGGEGEESGTLVLARGRAANELRVERAALPQRRVGRVTLERRDALWYGAQAHMSDMLHDAEGIADRSRALRTFVLQRDAVGHGLRAGGRDPALLDQAQAECALDIVIDAFERGLSVTETRELATLVAQAAALGSLCAVTLDSVTLPGMDAPGAVCHRALVADADGRTTVRAGPSATSEALRMASNGNPLDVLRQRGAWLKVTGSPPGWVHRSNVRCVR